MTSERQLLAIVLPELLDELARARAAPARTAPEPARAAARAVVLTEFQGQVPEPSALLDAVSPQARQRGVSTRQTIAQASALVESLVVHALPLECVTRALQQLAESVSCFGSPVALAAPDTVWVDITGSRHLFGGERELALEMAAQVRALGHTVRIAGAPGPWLARAFACHGDFDATGIHLVEGARVAHEAGRLPIAALPIPMESVAWFSRLGLLTLADLRRLPRAALGARLPPAGFERVLELIAGRDDGVLHAYQPEELPCEEQGFDHALESVEPLLFVLKGLAARLGARLEGRGQAAQELRLTIHYDRGIALLRARERHLAAPEADAGEPVFARELMFRLASPLAHADELERVVRSRLQRETLPSPASGLRLQVTALTEARQHQLELDATTGLARSISADPSTMTVLVAELSADIGTAAVGLLEARDSHLPEKSSGFIPVQHGDAGALGTATSQATAPGAHAALVLPTRLLAPIEIQVPLAIQEILVLEQRAYAIEAIAFEERLEAVEWWEPAPVSRDYFRVWLAALPPAQDGLEVLAYLNRDDGKSYIQAVFD